MYLRVKNFKADIFYVSGPDKANSHILVSPLKKRKINYPPRQYFLENLFSSSLERVGFAGSTIDFVIGFV